MRFIILIVCLIVMVSDAPAQHTGEDKAVVDVVRLLFKGMLQGDSAMVRTAFENDVTMATVKSDLKGDPVLVRESSLNGFLKAVGTPHPDPWNEEIWDIKVQRDGDFAQVWCSYAFYRGHTFSHCGVDAFHLFKGKDGWKIFHLADTRRKEGCEVPEDIERKYQR
jgi:Putative lumazine-binding